MERLKEQSWVRDASKVSEEWTRMQDIRNQQGS